MHHCHRKRQRTSDKMVYPASSVETDGESLVSALFAIVYRLLANLTLNDCIVLIEVGCGRQLLKGDVGLPLVEEYDVDGFQCKFRSGRC
jgi:cyclopropane fatty-acyl-phospholipid synthase-like methyltransferase